MKPEPAATEAHPSADDSFMRDGLINAIKGVVIDDDALSDLIAGDAIRHREKRPKNSLITPLTLDRYLRAVPDLVRYPISLDTAIEAVLESMSAHEPGVSPAALEDRLCTAHPEFAAQIRSAASLSNVLKSTAVLESLAARHIPLKPPCDFGPILPTGLRRYDLREVLGKGSQGVVYLATDREFADPLHAASGFVAVKLLRMSGVGDARRLDRLDEAIRARRVNHPNVVTVLDRGESAGVYYAVYEYVPGDNLERVGNSREFSPQEAARLVAQIADGVQAVHAVGLVHCDLKPANVLIGKDGTPKITDFGISTHQRAAGAHHTTGEAEGTLGFVAPEQYLRLPGGIAAAADVYALGGLLYWLLTRQPPNGSTSAEAQKKLRSDHSPPPSIKSHHRDADRDLDAICRRALEPTPGKRHFSANAFAEDLRAWLEHRPISWIRPSAGRRAVLLVRREPLVAVAAMLALCACLAMGLYAMSQSAAAKQAESLAKQSEALARESAAKTELETQRMSLVRTMVRTMRDSMARAPAGDFGEGWLPILSMMQSLEVGESIENAKTNEVSMLWSKRVVIATNIITELKETQTGDSFELLTWQMYQGIWQMQAKDYSTAHATLTDNVARWNAYLPAGDPWITSAQTFRDVARVFALASGADTPSPDELARLEHNLTPPQDDRASTNGQAVMALWRLRAQAVLHLHPKLLNRPDELSTWTRRLGRDRLSLVRELVGSPLFPPKPAPLSPGDTPGNSTGNATGN